MEQEPEDRGGESIAADEHLRRVAGRLLVTRGHAQSTGGVVTKLNEEAAAKQVAAALGRIQTRLAPSSIDADAVAAEASRKAAEALARPDVPLTAGERDSLQLIVRTMGRPALPVTAAGVERPPQTDGNEAWVIKFALHGNALDRSTMAVGALFRQSGSKAVLLGTAWRVPSGRLVTNRHVATHLTADRFAKRADWTLRADVETWVDFAYFNADPAAVSRTRLRRLVFVADEDAVDLAVIEPEPLPCGPELTIDWETSPSSDTEIYVVGHPVSDLATAEVVAIFAKADGRKRFAPGLIGRARNGGSGFEHDCSTLTGNSGSCAIDFGTGLVRGLHYGGTKPDVTGAMGEANLCLAFASLNEHPCKPHIINGQVG